MANYNYVQSSGVIVPDTATLLSDVQNEYKAAFGSDLIVTADTPQGVLITAETLARDNMVRNNAALANQINPNSAGGIFLDAICALTGLERNAATRSTVSATLTGVVGTIITAGTRAQTTSGDVFEVITAVTIGVGGTIMADFQSVEFGPIPALAGELTQIVDGILGWETITNPSNATLGSLQQSDSSLRVFRRNTLGLQGVNTAVAITSRLYSVTGVKSLTFRENLASTTETIDGVSMVGHSIYVCVDGGANADIANALLETKPAGTNWNGSTTVTITDPTSGQAYIVKFARPSEITINIRATVRVGVSTSDPTTTIKNALLAYANGELSDEQGFVVGGDVSTFELAGAINRLQPSIYVKKIEISDDGGLTWQTDEILIGIDQVARTNAAAITVVIE